MAEKLTTLLSEVEDTIWDFWSIPFEFLGVESSNAEERANFSTEVSLKLGIKSDFVPMKCSYMGTPLCEVYLESIFTVLLGAGGKYSEISDERQKHSVETLINFMKNLEEEGNHYQCLRKLHSMQLSSESEALVQAVLACHLFCPLVSEGKVVVDEIPFKRSETESGKNLTAECPFCKQSLKPENNKFGVKDLWHGRADIVIKAKNCRKVVNVTVDKVEEDKEDGFGEPAAKKEELVENTCCLAEEKTIFEQSLTTFLNERPYKQAICQTILNAFLAVKNNVKLENMLIPSFLVCQSSVFINFYNVDKDILLVQTLPMKFFEGGINYAAFFSVWMALNFEVFPLKMYDKFYSTAKQSGFGHSLKVKGVFEKYKNDISDQLSYGKDNPSDEQSRKHAIPKRKRDELLALYSNKMNTAK